MRKLFAIGTNVSLTIGVHNGLGRLDWKAGSESQQNSLQKPFLQSLNSGMIGNDDIRRRGGDISQKNGYNFKKASKKILRSLGTDSTISISPDTHSKAPLELKGMPVNQYSQGRTEAFVRAERNELQDGEWDVGSQTSTSRFIHQTQTYTVGTE
ncbi:MAG: hypothetical protein Q9187_003941 [Circinaria calcarea]